MPNTFRGITKVTLYEQGLVICRDAAGRQAPPLQGMFADVIDRVKECFAPDDVKWLYRKGSEITEVSFEQWCKHGEAASGQIGTKPSSVLNEGVVNITGEDHFD